MSGVYTRRAILLDTVASVAEARSIAVFDEPTALGPAFSRECSRHPRTLGPIRGSRRVPDALRRLASARRLLVLSAHADDAAFSAGGMLQQFAAHSDITIVTVFSQSAWTVRALPPEFASVTAHRAHEDLTYCRRIGARQCSLGLPDASLRGYDVDTELHADPTSDPVVRPLSTALRRLLQAHPESDVLAPAAVGGHVDHRLLRDATLREMAPGRTLVLYEDLPYAWNCGPTELEHLASVYQSTSTPVEITGALDAKMSNLRVYGSQLEERDAEAIYGHARRIVGSSRAIERVVTVHPDTRSALLRGPLSMTVLGSNHR